MSGLAAVWFALALLAGWLDRPVSPGVLSSVCFAAIGSIMLGRRDERRRGFDEGYQMAARHAVDIARACAFQASGAAEKASASNVAEKLKDRLEIEGARRP